MPNVIIFNIGGDTIDVNRNFLEKWYKENNPYDYPYDLMKYELSRTSIKDLAELYINNELSGNGLEVTYELFRDPDDTDVAEELMREIRGIYEELIWMLPREDLLKFFDELLKDGKKSSPDPGRI